MTEQPFAEYAPKALVLIGLIATLAGSTAYFTGSPDTDQRNFAEKRPERTVAIASLAATPAPIKSQPVEPTRQLTQTAVTSQKQVIEPTIEAVQYCGAMTKKGTPCSRRVKGNIRCFQHAGMPAAAELGR